MSTPTTLGLRSLGAPRDPDEVLFVDVESHEPYYVARGEAIDDVHPGNVVEATLEWADGEPRIREVAVRERTLLAFADGVGNLFEAALDTWEEARRESVAVNSRVTHDTARNPVGAVYTFAEQPGARDVFREVRDGSLPLEPLLRRAAETEPPPHEAFVLRPAAHEFVLVYVVLDAGSVLADTVRDTYGCPRPTDALATGERAAPDDAG